MDKSIVSATFSLLNQDFELSQIPEELNESMAITELTRALALLLDRDFERVLQISYRVDLGEHLLKKILSESQPDQIAGDLARALWHRQKQKIGTRRRYAQDLNL